MIGVYDFCGHYDWTFEWLRQAGGEALVRQYWDEAIHQDSQRHAADQVGKQGFEGMANYWGHTLKHEGAGYSTTKRERVFRIDMHECPSRGFLLRNGLGAYHDYCDHCMGWIGPMLKAAGFTADHQHNHRGQCWWELRRAKDSNPSSDPGTLAGDQDVRLRPDWNPQAGVLDTFVHATAPSDKQ